MRICKCPSSELTNISGVRPTLSHVSERRVTRGIDEGDGVSVFGVGLVGGDGLRDAASLSGGDASVANSIQEGGLAMVNVSHDGDDGGTGLEVSRVILVHGNTQFKDGAFRFFAAVIMMEIRDRVSVGSNNISLWRISQRKMPLAQPQ